VKRPRNATWPRALPPEWTGRFPGVPTRPQAEGRLAVGETVSVRLIRGLRRRARPHEGMILDAPPGRSCPVVEAIRGAPLLGWVRADPYPNSETGSLTG
jgi:hypothetical protein